MAPGVSPYEKSKTIAEKAAWEFVGSLPADEKFALVTINPGMIVGPNLVTTYNVSCELTKGLLMGELPGLPYMRLPSIDVRDCADAHLEAVLRD